jgi:hypothetical protein
VPETLPAFSETAAGELVRFSMTTRSVPFAVRTA